MEKVERRIEVVEEHVEHDYAAVEMDEAKIAEREHRRFVGGRWNEIGTLQRDYLVSRGLQPGHALLDVGCGALRAGRHFVSYLEPNGYYGIDINPTLIEAGWNVELDDEQRAKLPLSNLRSTDRFDADFGVQFDMAIANSVFTHVSLNHMRLALFRLSKVMRSGGEFYATYFERDDGFPLDGVFGKVPKQRFYERNVFWYYRRDMEWVSSDMPFEAIHIGDWGHPRNQQMMLYKRL